MVPTAYAEHLNNGNVAYGAGDFATAAEAYRQAVAANPTGADGHRLLSFAEYARSNYAEAAESARRAVALQPEAADNHLALGLALSGLQDLDGAVTSLEEAVKHRPDHAHAKATLVHVLMSRGQRRLAEGNDFGGEHDLMQAYKLDRKNAEPIRVLSKHFLDAGLKPRAVKVVQEAVNDNPNDPLVRSMALHLGVSAQTKEAEAAAKRDAVRQSQEVPCSACKKPIMEWAAVCPHCGTQIKTIPSQFAGRDTGPAFTWQEIAYKIGSVIWILMGAWNIVVGIMVRGIEGYWPGMEAPFVIIGTVQAAIGIGLLCEVEWLQFVAKLMCYLVFLRIGWGFMLGMGFRSVMDIVMYAVEFVFAAFFLYLLKEVGGD